MSTVTLIFAPGDYRPAVGVVVPGCGLMHRRLDAEVDLDAADAVFDDITHAIERCLSARGLLPAVSR